MEKKESHICAAVVVFSELLTCIDKMVPSLRGSISQTRQEVLPTQRLQKEEAEEEEEAIFLLVMRKLKEKLNLQMDNLYQSPH